MGYTGKKGEEIKIIFLDGKSIKGKLLGAFTYEILLEVEMNGEPSELSIFKHAIKYVPRPQLKVYYSRLNRKTHRELSFVLAFYKKVVQG